MKRRKPLLAQQEEYRKLVFQALDVHVVVIDKQGNIVDVNDAWINFASRNGIADPRSTMMNVNYLDVLSRSQENGDEAIEEAKQGVMGVLDGSRSSYIGEYLCNGPTDSYWFKMKVMPLPGPQGGAVITQEDITAHKIIADANERKHSETVLGDSKERFHLMFEKHDAVMLLIEPNSGAIIDANLAAEKFYGYSYEQLKWMKIDQINMLSPEEVRQERLKAAGESRNHFVFPHRLASGEVRMVEVHSSPLQIDGIDLLFSIIHDITERKQAEQALRESEEKYKLFTELSPVATVIHQDGKIKMVSTAGIHIFGGTSEKDFIDRSIFDFIHPDWIAAARQRIIQALHEGKPAPQAEMVFKKLGGQDLQALSLGTPIQYQGKLAILSTIVDITEQKKVKADLLESEQKFTTAFQISPVGMVISRKSDGTFLEVNQELERISGYSRAEILGQSAMSMGLFTEPELREKFVDKGPLQDVELQVKHKSGAWRWISLSSQPIKLNNEDCFIIIIRDIEEKKQADQSLRESEAKFATAFHTSPLGLGIVDANNKHIEVNQVVCDLFGLPRAEILGKTTRELGILDEAQEQKIQTAFARAGGRIDNLEIEIKNRNGSVRQVLYSVNSLDINGRTHFIGTSLDITDRNRAEEALRASEEKYRSLVESLDSVVSMFDADGRLTYHNSLAARQFGRAVSEMIGKTIHELFPEPVASRHLASIQRVFRENQTLTVEAVTVVKGQPRWYRTTILPLHDENGRVVSVLVNATDIHDLKTAQQELLELNRTLEERVKERTAQIQDLYDNAPSGYHSFDSEGRLQFVNATELNWLGRTRDEVLGHSFADFVLPQQAEQFYAKHLRPIVDGRSVYDLEYDLLRSDGTTIPVLVQCEPVLDANGQFIRSRGTLINITERKSAEQVLRQSEEKYSTLFHKSAVPTILSSYPESIYVDVNEIFTKQYGYTREDMLGKTSIEVGLVRPAERAHMFEEFKKHGLLTGNQLPVFTKWGEERIVLVNSQKIEFDDRAYLISTAYDVTEQKRAEATLRENEERMKFAFRAAQDGIWDWNLETDEVFYSSRYKSMLGYEEDEIEPHVSAWKRLVHPDDMPRAMQVVEAVLRGESDYVIEFRMRHKDGHYVDILSRGFPIRNEPQSSIVRIVGTHFDLTERKNAETALLATVKRINTLYTIAQGTTTSNGAPELLQMVADTLVNTLNVDRVTIFLLNLHEKQIEYICKSGPGVHDVVDVSFEEVWDGLSGWSLRNRAVAFSPSDRPDDRESPAVQKRRQETHAGDIIVTPLIYKDSAHGTITAIKRPGAEEFVDGDIDLMQAIGSQTSLAIERLRVETDLRQINLELERALRVKDDFLAGMSHELRTPLTGILGVSELLLNNVYGELNARQNKYVQLIDSSGRHLLSLINDILDLSKLEVGRLTAHFEVISINEICQMSLSFVKQAATKKRIALSLSCENGALPLVADPLRLKQILVNLLDNAIKFTPEEGRVILQVKTSEETKTIVFTIIDTGIGIPPEDISKLFKPFTQLDSSLSRNYEGTGLGLSLAGKMAELHNGTVTVESKVGQGSKFIVTLPWRRSLDHAQPREIQSVETIQPELPIQENAVRKLILLTEDNEVNVGVIKDFLNYRGYDVILARHGGEVISMVEENHPDLIIMDIQMPVMDGLEATRLIRSKPEFKDLPIIAVTALAMPGDKERCFDAGVNEYMSKPLGLKNLVGMIEKLLE